MNERVICEDASETQPREHICSPYIQNTPTCIVLIITEWLSCPVSLSTHMHQWRRKWTHRDRPHLLLLLSLVGCRSRQSPWCVQKSGDELNAVCLCPGRDHHINIALIQRSVCSMLITSTLVLTLRLLYSLLLWDGEVRGDRLLIGFNLWTVVVLSQPWRDVSCITRQCCAFFH